MPIVGVVPKGSKDERLMNHIGMFESGKIAFPKKQKWLEDLESELFTFPNSVHDDQVDSITQFLDWYKKTFKQKRFAARII
jgi:predicted phage terminase large subunit-like protein